MKIDVTLDPDIVAQLEKLQRERGTTLDEVANDALRIGLPDMANGSEMDQIRDHTGR